MASQNQTITCEFCQSTFACQKNLESHKKMAKYCLTIQGLGRDKHKCSGCDKSFSNNHWLNHHQMGCLNFQIIIKTEQIEKDKKILEEKINILEKDNSELKILNIKLQDTIKELAEKAIANAKPTTITNNTNNTNHNNTTINNLQVISEAHINDHVKHLTIDHIKRGALGYSEYFLEYPLKERVVCTDYSRRKLKYKNENGEIVSDPEMTTLSDLLFKSIKERNRELTIQYSSELTDKFKTTKDPAQLAYFMEVASKFSQQDLDVFKMFSGNKNEFFHDILRNICSKTVVQ